MTALGPLRSFAADLARMARFAVRGRLDRVVVRAQVLPSLRFLATHRLRVESLLALYAVATPDRAAMEDVHGVLTYADAAREVARVVRSLRAFGVSRGSVLALAMENRVEYVLAWFAAMRLGARVLHLDPRLTAAELAPLLREAHARIAFVDEVALGSFAQLLSDHPTIAPIVVTVRGAVGGDEVVSWPAFLREGDATSLGAEVASAPSESVVYTSGTTGRPKGAVRDFGAFGPIELTRVVERLPFCFGDRHLVVAPLHHSAAQAFALIHLALGGTLHLARFDAKDTLRTLTAERIHSVFLVPTMLRRILESDLDARGDDAFSELRAVVSGAGELTPDLRDAAIARFGATRVFELYGATEIGWVTLIDGSEMLRKPGSVGRPLAGQEIAILNRAGDPLPVGEVGLVYVRNRQTISRYLADLHASIAMRREGRATVEDLGRLDADGYLYLAGRARDMVKTGGVNVYPMEVEQVIAAHPSVHEVAVVGVPDPAWGERLVGYVAIKEGAAFDAADLTTFARERLASYKVPRSWVVVEALPRNALGKVSKRALLESMRVVAAAHA